MTQSSKTQLPILHNKQCSCKYCSFSL